MVTIFRKTDAIGRFGGDEFVVLMTSLSHYEVAKTKADEVVKSVVFKCAQKLHIEVSISVGVAACEETDSFDTLFARADQALYEAKNTGKAKVVVYGSRICAVCVDMNDKKEKDSQEFFDYLMKSNGERECPIVAICEENNMEQIKQCMEFEPNEIITLPPEMDTIKRRISRVVLLGISKNKEFFQ